MRTFSNMGTSYLVLSAQSYNLAIETLTQRQFCLIRDGDYNKKFQLIKAKIDLLTELRDAALREAGLSNVPKITD